MQHMPGYRMFSRTEWSKQEPTLCPQDEGDISMLFGCLEPILQTELQAVYWPLAMLLSGYVHAYQQHNKQLHQRLHMPMHRPFIVGLAGSVAVGKSTASRLLAHMLRQVQPVGLSVAIVPTDGFLYTNKILEQRGLLTRKGFPESYDTKALMQFLRAVKRGETGVQVPQYSHVHYDIMPDAAFTLDMPDVIILEGLNVLQLPKSEHGIQHHAVFDYMDFSIYLDAEPGVIADWFRVRFHRYQQAAKDTPGVFMHQFHTMDDDAALAFADSVWRDINYVNLIDNILPTKARADLVLHKNARHAIDAVYMRDC